MTNPFQAFNISDDEQTFQVATQQKVKRTHHEKRIYKQQQQQAAKAPVATVQIEQPIEKAKENTKVIRHNNKTYQEKKVGEGHYLDRRSGTGRVDKPRKQGGGYGNVGNIKDQLNKDKYIQQSPKKTPAEEAADETKTAEQVEPVEPKPEQPKTFTLEQYYKNKGLEINNVYEKKAPAIRGQVNAEWIKKQKLTVLQSKEDKKISERNGQNIVKFTSSRVGLDQNLQSLGFFGKKTEKKPEQRQQRRENAKPEYKGKGKGKKNNPVIQQQDFPSL